MLKATAVFVLIFFLASCELLDDMPREGVSLELIESSCDNLKVEKKDLGDRRRIRVSRQPKFGGQCYVECAVTRGFGDLTNEQWCKETADNEESVQIAYKEAEDRAKAEREARESNDKRLRELAAADERKGYTKLTFEDFRLDEKTMPVGKKIFINGYYEGKQGWQHITNCLGALHCIASRYVIPVNIETAARDTRKRLIEYQETRGCWTGIGVCMFTILGRVSRCSYTEFGSFKVSTCIELDDFHEI